MKFLFVLVALVAFAAADDVKYNAPERKCAWNVDVVYIDEYAGVNGIGAYSSWVKTTHYFNGLFYAARVKDYGGNVISRGVYRPDLNARFLFSGGTCAKMIVPEGLKIDNFYKLLDYVEATSHEDDPILHMVTGNHTFRKCDDGEWDGKKAKKYYNIDTDGLSAVLYVSQKNDEALAYEVKEKVEVLGVSFSHTRTYTFDFGTKAYMSDFSFSKGEAWKCPDDKIYDSGDSAYAFCAAFTTKAALSLVLAAIAVALLSIF